LQHLRTMPVMHDQAQGQEFGQSQDFQGFSDISDSDPVYLSSAQDQIPPWQDQPWPINMIDPATSPSSRLQQGTELLTSLRQAIAQTGLPASHEQQLQQEALSMIITQAAQDLEGDAIQDANQDFNWLIGSVGRALQEAQGNSTQELQGNPSLHDNGGQDPEASISISSNRLPQESDDVGNAQDPRSQTQQAENGLPQEDEEMNMCPLCQERVQEPHASDYTACPTCGAAPAVSCSCRSICVACNTCEHLRCSVDCIAAQTRPTASRPYRCSNCRQERTMLTIQRSGLPRTMISVDNIHASFNLIYRQRLVVPSESR